MYYWILIVFWQNEEESEENKKSSLKGLAGCTQINDQARIFIVDHKGSLQSDKISLIFVIFLNFESCKHKMIQVLYKC